MRAVYLLLMLALLPLVTADYYLGVAEDAPAADVVEAANIAAQIKAQTGIEFSGMVDSDIFEQLDIDELGSDHVVLLHRDDNYALYIVDESRHANGVSGVLEDEGFRVIELASGEPYTGAVLREYFPRGYIAEQQDFLLRDLNERGAGEIESIDPDEPTDFPRRDSAVPADADERPSPEVEPTETPANTGAETGAENQTPTADSNTNTSPVVVAINLEPQEERGAVGRFWGWLRGLFS